MTTNSPIDDAALLDRWVAGDKRSGARLFARYSAPLYRFFVTRVPNEAADLTQSTLLACVQNANQVRERHSFRSYLFGIARHLLLEHYRAAGVRRAKQLFNTTSMFDRGPSPSTAYVRRTIDTNLMRALETLPAETRMLLELAYWEDIPGPGLAEVFGVPENTIYTRLHRAKQRLRAALDKLESPANIHDSSS